VNEYFNNYKKMLMVALDTVDQGSINAVEYQLFHMATHGYPILVCGNGGSAAIAEHMTCDHTKGVITDTHLSPFLIPLQSNVSLCSAIANDIGYDQVFSYQINAYPNDKKTQFGVLVISSSGNSPNIINALNAAKQRKIVSIAMVGFDGGKAKEMADFCIHVKSDNYGIVEDAHQIIMHSMAQSIRVHHATKEAKLKL
jgi:D-sedoheptulose 7-phosphate isomerase/D-glycero-D-manno-heptose 1,7-bisphosphate phosphatase